MLHFLLYKHIYFFIDYMIIHKIYIKGKSCYDKLPSCVDGLTTEQISHVLTQMVEEAFDTWDKRNLLIDWSSGHMFSSSTGFCHGSSPFSCQ
jgi:uncharacterized protein (DUF779 family)